MPYQLLGVQLHTMAMSGLSRVRTELLKLLVIPSLAPHPVQTNRQSTGHGDPGDLPPPPHRQVKILTAPFRDAAHRDLGCFHQQETQYRTPRLGDMSEPSPIATGVAETGLRMYLAEKKARKVGCRTRPDTFSSPVGRQNLRNCGNFQRFLQ